MPLATMGANPEVRSVVVEASQDTYMVVDTVPPGQIETVTGIVSAPPNPVMDENFGKIAFLRVWYKALEPEKEQLLSLGLLKFELIPLKDL